ncbi:MAG: hypothetical protein LBV58_02485 [Acholeplasmatales bacterium]|jgi:hypothetical protein|nr:hypothetical protein [Acholeplasmatales bacterium]
MGKALNFIRVPKTKKEILNLIQKVVTILFLLTIGSIFVYSLGLSTNWAIAGNMNDVPLFQVEAQKINFALFEFSLWALVITVLSFLFGSFKHKKYYIYNYLFIGLSLVVALGLIIFVLVKVPYLRDLYVSEIPIIDPDKTSLSELDPLEVTWFWNFLNSKSEYSLLTFQIGIIIGITSLVVWAMVLAYTIYQFVQNHIYHEIIDKIKVIKSKLSRKKHETIS